MKTALQPLKNSLFNKKRKTKPDITKTMTKFTVQNSDVSPGQHGVMLEWLKRLIWKVSKRQKRFGGSNPPHSAKRIGDENPGFVIAKRLRSKRYYYCQTISTQIKINKKPLTDSRQSRQRRQGQKCCAVTNAEISIKT